MTRSATAMSDESLPDAPSALQKIARNSLWAHELQLADAQSRRRAWTVAGIAVGLAVMGMSAALFQFLRPPPAPPVLMVDRRTGETIVLPNLDEKTVPQIAALDLHNAAKYVRAREGYNYSMLNGDYEQVARMSTPETWSPYQKQFVGPEALHEKLSDKELRRVTVIGVRPRSDWVPGKAGEALVTYEREVRNQSLPQPLVTRYVATVRYEYRPASVKKAVDRLENPFGFVVTGYRSDAEVAASRVESVATTGQGGS